MKNRRAVIVGPQKIEIIEEDLPVLNGDQILVKMVSVGMCHTDLPSYIGNLSETRSKNGLVRMDAGTPGFPVGTGHEPVGIVHEVGKTVRNYKVGEYIGGFGSGLTDGALSEYIILDDSMRTFAPIPADTEKNIAYCCAEPLGCVVNIVKVASPQFADTIAVIGCGFMGLMVIAGLRNSGAKKIVAIDLIDSKLEKAKEFGATDVINPRNSDVDDAAYDLTNGRMFDIVVEISGSLKGLDTAGKIIKAPHKDGIMGFDGSFKGLGKILLPSVYSGQEIFPMSLAFNFMLKTPVLHVTHPTYAFSMRDNMQEGIAAFMDGRLPCDELISHEFKFEDSDKAFQMLVNQPEDYIKGVIVF